VLGSSSSEGVSAQAHDLVHDAEVPVPMADDQERPAARPAGFAIATSRRTELSTENRPFSCEGSSSAPSVNNFNNPFGIAADSSGHIYRRYVQPKDRAIEPESSYQLANHARHPGQRNQPVLLPPGVAVDASGRIYVADGNNAKIVRMNDMLGTAWATLAEVRAVESTSSISPEQLSSHLLI
jgi:hypothetical protein